MLYARLGFGGGWFAKSFVLFNCSHFSYTCLAPTGPGQQPSLGCTTTWSAVLAVLGVTVVSDGKVGTSTVVSETSNGITAYGIQVRFKSGDPTPAPRTDETVSATQPRKIGGGEGGSSINTPQTGLLRRHPHIRTLLDTHPHATPRPRRDQFPVLLQRPQYSRRHRHRRRVRRRSPPPRQPGMLFLLPPPSKEKEASQTRETPRHASARTAQGTPRHAGPSPRGTTAIRAPGPATIAAAVDVDIETTHVDDAAIGPDPDRTRRREGRRKRRRKRRQRRAGGVLPRRRAGGAQRGVVQGQVDARVGEQRVDRQADARSDPADAVDISGIGMTSEVRPRFLGGPVGPCRDLVWRVPGCYASAIVGPGRGIVAAAKWARFGSAELSKTRTTLLCTATGGTWPGHLDWHGRWLQAWGSLNPLLTHARVGFFILS